jgi:peroxiredoxin
MDRRQCMLKIFVLCLVLALPSVGFTMGRLPSEQEKAGGLIGKKAPDFILETSAGEKKSLNQVRGGQKAVLFFWATWCPHCHGEIVRLNNNAEDLRQKGIQVVLINMGESKGEVSAYLQYNQVNLDTFLDEANVLQEPYQIIGVPTLYFIDENGTTRNITHSLPSNYEELFK